MIGGMCRMGLGIMMLWMRVEGLPSGLLLDCLMKKMIGSKMRTPFRMFGLFIAASELRFTRKLSSAGPTSYGHHYQRSILAICRVAGTL